MRRTATWTPSWLNGIRGELGKSRIMPYMSLQLPKSCFIALLFFFTGKVYCSIISLPALTLGFSLLNTIFLVMARGVLEIAVFVECIRWFAVHCCITARLYGLFPPPPLFFLYYPPTAGFICPLALITIKTFWLMPLFPGFRSPLKQYLLGL